MSGAWALIAVAGVSAAPAFGGADAQTELWVGLASTGLDQRVAWALGRMPDPSRQLLALRAYLRSGDSLAQRWTWSDERLSTYASSTEGVSAAADLDAVSVVFARENPGFTLQVNREPRSFGRQLEHWNENPGVASVSRSLRAAMRAQFPGRGVEPLPEEIRRALVEWHPAAAAPLAAPGLSPHGQARAFDFAVSAGGRTVATTEVASAHRNWDSAGWTARLQRAIADSGRPFIGPLQSPYEPWHYAYQPRP